MRVGIYGGSFNPVHNAHVGVVDLVVKEGLVDEVWLMPCKTHAFSKDLVSQEHRLKMLELAFQGFDKVKINYTELDSEDVSYTSKTIKKLKSEYSHDFYFIAGTDALNSLDKWYDSAYLRDSLNFIGVKRSGYSFSVENLNLEKLVDANLSLSSTAIRKKISEGKSISGLVPKKVEDYILSNQLYFPEFKNPASTVDLIVPNNGKIIWIKRRNNPFKDCWALPGGFIDYGRETLEEAAVRELREETSLETDVNTLRLVGVYSNPSRDPRGHVISHVYEVLDYSGNLRASDDAKSAKFFKAIPRNLAFDHHKIISDYKIKFGGAS